MEDETGGLLLSSSVNNASQQFSISAVSLPQALPDSERSENKIDTVTAANDLLENGILVETNKGLVELRMICGNKVHLFAYTPISKSAYNCDQYVKVSEFYTCIAMFAI
jgi:hypothetical protein